MTIVPTDTTSARRAAGVALGAAMLTTGLIAGVYYSFVCAVMLGLAPTDDRIFVEVMQRINVKIVNPVFALSFFGALVCNVAAVVLQRRLGRRLATPWIMASLTLYVASLIVTAGVNIPLNDQLARAGNTNPTAARQQFEKPWVTWNTIRALLSIAALGCLGRALILHGRGTSRPEG